MRVRPPARARVGAVTLVGLTLTLLAVDLAVRRSDFAGLAAVGLGLVVTASVGAVVGIRRPDHPAGWLLMSLTVFASASIAGTDYVQASLTAPNPYPLTSFVGWMTTWVGFPPAGLGAILLLTFPTGRLTSRRWRALALAAVVAIVLASVSAALMPGPLPIAASMDNPLGWGGAGDVLSGIDAASSVVMAVVLISAVVRLVVRYRRGTGVEHDQLRMLARALPITALGIVGAAIASGPLNEASFYFAVLGLTAVPVSIGWAVIRYGLFDIRVFINRAVVYGSLTIIIGALYVLLVVGFGQALRESLELGVSLVATAVVAVIFAPLRDHLQRITDGLMYGERARPYEAISGLGRRLEDAAAPEDALSMAAEALGHSLRLRGVRIESLRDAEMQERALWGEAPLDGISEFVDLVHGRELVGRLTVWPRAVESLSDDDRRLIAELARPIAVVVHAGSVREELVLSRQHLVAAREEERRRLRADLHDGLGPDLAGVMLGLGAVRNMLRADPVAAETMLGDLQQHVRDAVKQVRSLVDGLAPTVEQLGLAVALREGATRLATSAGLEVEIDIPPELPLLPAAAEVAVYRIAMESLTNVVRHSGATRCELVLRADGDAVIIEVIDDGTGIPATLVPGVGLSSMRRRAEEIGGTCTIEPLVQGGTRVSARLPVG